MNNDIIIGLGIMKLYEFLNKKDIDLPHTADILNNVLEELDKNSENYENKVKTITEAIIELKKGEKYDRENIMNKMFCIQQLFDLNSMLNRPVT